MLGSPLVRSAVVLAVLLLLAVPLVSLTAPRAATEMPEAAVTAASAARLEIVSTKAPFTFAVSHLGETIWQGDSRAGPLSTTVPLPIPAEGVDLLLEVKWRDAGVAAAKLALSHDGESAERTLWGDGSAEDVLTFP